MKLTDSLKNFYSIPAMIGTRLALIFVWPLSLIKFPPILIVILGLIASFYAFYLILIQNYLSAGIWILVITIFDHVDGQLARYTNKCSIMGGWLDLLADRVKDFTFLYAVTFSFFITTDNKNIIILGFLAILITILRHTERLIRKDVLGLKDSISTSGEQNSKRSLLFKIIKDTLSFTAGDRGYIIGFLLIINQPIWILYLFVFWQLPIVLIKTINGWKTDLKKSAIAKNQPLIK